MEDILIGFVEDILIGFVLFWEKTFDFKGITSRKEYWCGTLSNVILFCGLFIFSGMISAINSTTPPAQEQLEAINNPFSLMFYTAVVIYCLWFFIGLISIYYRRMRDIGKSAFFAFILQVLTAIPYLGIIPGIYTIYLMCKPSRITMSL